MGKWFANELIHMLFTLVYSIACHQQHTMYDKTKVNLLLMELSIGKVGFMPSQKKSAKMSNCDNQTLKLVCQFYLTTHEPLQ